MKHWHAVVCGILLCLSAVTWVRADVFHTTLDNGLTVLIEEHHANPVVSVNVFVRTGSIYEQEYLGSGISHFFEHIISGGTTSNRSEAESRTLLETIGNNSNAYTTTDHTAYYINTTTAHWTTALDLLADWMLHSLITEEEFTREKGVVQRELEQTLDNPLRQLFQLTNEVHYQVHPARYPVIGYKERVQQVTRDDLLTYYHRMYTPNNMILVVVGDVDTTVALDAIRRAFASGERRPLPAISLPDEPPQVGKRTATQDMDIAQAHMSVSFRTVPLLDPDLYALDVLSYILSEGNSSRLIKRIQDDQQLVYRIDASSFTPFYAPGSLMVRATLDPTQLKAAKAAITRELYRLRDDLVTPQELAKAKKQKVADHVFARETVQQRASALGTDMLSTYDPNFGDAYVNHIQAVNAEAVRDVARRYFRDDGLSVVVVGPKQAVEQAAKPPAVVQASPMVKRVLDNGMTLLLERDPALPKVDLQAFFKGGVRVETEATNGLSQMMAHMLLKGTTYRSADDIATAFDMMGGTLDADSGSNSFYVTAACLAEDLPSALDIFADVIVHPTFPETELEKVRRLMLAALQRQNDNWQSEVQNVFRQTFFTVSPYRLDPDGQEAPLQNLTRQDIVDFHQRYAVPNNMVMAIAGDIDVERTAALVERAFAGFKSRPLDFPQIPPEPVPTERRRHVKPTNKQVAAIEIGFPGTAVSNLDDRYALHILDAVMSGIGFPGGWLHTDLRSKQLVYYVHAFNWLGLEPGYFGIVAATQPPQTQAVVDTVLQYVDKARAGDIDDAELERAKQLAVIAHRFDQQTSSERAMAAALNELYGLGYDFSAQTVEHLSQVTKADVQRVAQTYLQHPTVVITTPQP